MRYDSRNQPIRESMTTTEQAVADINAAVMDDVKFPSSADLANAIRSLHDRGYDRPLDNLTADDIAASPDPRGYVRALIDGTGLTVQDVCNRDFSRINA